LANSRATIISTGNAGAAGFLTSDGPYPGLQLKPIDEHPDAGKTALTEKLLLFGGAIQLAGEVKARGDRRRARSDWMAIERERGISVSSAVMSFEHQGLALNVADTDEARTGMALYWSG